MTLKDEALALEPLKDKMLAAAHHEAGHIVVAAARGLKICAKGIVIDALAKGIACYCMDPKGSDSLRIDILLATFAGFYSEQHCREENGLPLREETWLAMGDGWQANQLLRALSDENLVSGSASLTGDKLKRQSRQLVLEKWPVIKALASEVLRKELGPMPELNS